MGEIRLSFAHEIHYNGYEFAAESFGPRYNDSTSLLVMLAVQIVNN
jgi:hypothetical protein